MLGLHREWFEEEPTDEDISRFDGNPDKMKEVFGSLGFSLREMKDVYELPPENSIEAVRAFGEQIGLEDGAMSFEAIDAMTVQERLGIHGFHHLDYYQKYSVDLDNPEAPDEVEFPEDQVAAAEGS